MGKQVFISRFILLVLLDNVNTKPICFSISTLELLIYERNLLVRKLSGHCFFMYISLGKLKFRSLVCHKTDFNPIDQCLRLFDLFTYHYLNLGL